MSLISGVDAITASCLNPLHPDYFHTEAPDQYQIKVVYGVNKLFWRSFDNMVLDWVCPGYPTTLAMHFYEHFDDPPSTDPLITVAGFIALCTIPPAGLGTSKWLWMATLDYYTCTEIKVSPLYIHVQYKNTNAGSVGFIRYPFTPPT
jgi:hypothetical protein